MADLCIPGSDRVTGNSSPPKPARDSRSLINRRCRSSASLGGHSTLPALLRGQPEKDEEQPQVLGLWRRRAAQETPVRRLQMSFRADMAAAGAPRGLAVPGGGESSDSDDGWEIGYLDRPRQKLRRPLPIEEKNEAFKKALTVGDISLVEELLDSGINVDSSFRYGWTPLMYAASVANAELVRVLLDRGANASFDKDKQTILITACSARGSEEQILKCVELLLSRNVDPNVACRRLMTPVMYAARDCHPQVVALLVVHGAEVNAQDENGYTALTWAARQGHKSVVLKLLELGANKMLQTKDGKTPSEIAKMYKHHEVFSLLSLILNPLEGRLQLTKEETICKLLTSDSDKEKDHIFGSYTAFGELEVFLHGLGLEHMTDLLKEKDITLRHLLTMNKDEFAENGITSKDQQKIVAALKELEVGEINFGELPEVAKLEISGDEFLNFLLKLNKQCGHLITAVQNIITELPVNSHKIVLEWASPRNFASVCDELVSNAEDLSEEVRKLKDLIRKLQNERESDPSHVPLIEKVSTWKSRLLKRSAVTVCGLGLLLFVCKITFQKKIPSLFKSTPPPQVKRAGRCRCRRGRSKDILASRRLAQKPRDTQVSLFAAGKPLPRQLARVPWAETRPPPLPRDPLRLSTTSPGSQPSDTARSGPGAEPRSSRVVGGAGLFPSPPFPDPNGDVSGSAWEGPDLPGTGVGEGGGDDSIFQVFGISGLGLVQPLTAPDEG
ncbi:ankyrin repeat, SAM and basic leucine zipper domain-containing protein 1 [Ctenodactylus gundi]